MLHFIAMAKSVGVELTQDDFQAISDRIPVLADFKPSGKYLMQDLHEKGGSPAVMKYLLRKGLLQRRAAPSPMRSHSQCTMRCGLQRRRISPLAERDIPLLSNQLSLQRLMPFMVRADGPSSMPREIVSSATSISSCFRRTGRALHGDWPLSTTRKPAC